MENLEEINYQYGGKNYFFIRGDVCNQELLDKIFLDYEIDTVVHFAAESHVDRSISGPRDFINTNIFGTFSLLEVARKFWGNSKDVLFHHVSTDEVYGSLGKTGFFYETNPYDPRSPYSASKASSDHLVKAYYHTYDMSITISNCSNNYGPYQFPEKLIPLIILNIQNEKPLPIYGDGKYVRDWLFVDDHISAIWAILKNGRVGENYNIGGENEWENIRLVEYICDKMSFLLKKDNDYYKKLISYVKDRPGHDRRYAINCDKLKNELKWKQSTSFEVGLDKTIYWYLNNKKWINNILTGKYKDWIDLNYGKRVSV